MKTNRLQLIQPILHFVVIVFSYRAMYLLRQYTDLIPFVQLRIPVIDFQETMLFALWSACLFISIAMIQELYVLFVPTDRSYGNFLQTWLLRVMLSGFIAWLGFGYVFVSGISRFVLVFASGLSLILLSWVDLVRDFWIARVHRKHPYRLLLIGDDMQKIDTLRQDFAWSDGYSIQHTSSTIFQTPRWDDRDACLLLGAYDAWLLQTRGDQCLVRGKSLYHLPDGHFLDDILTRPVRLWPVMTIAYSASPLSGRWRVVKRSGDIIVAFFWLLVLAPLLLCIAILIKLDSPWPVLYFQNRVGKNKQLFRFVKFRSMYTHLSTGIGYGGDAAWKLERELESSDANIRKGQLMKINNDPRVTPVWRLLRKYSLDELASLWCVLVWDMSLIWPRPHLPHEVEKYDDRHQRLFSVKPGITGYAQLHGRDKIPFDEEAKLDLRYIQHRSLWLDIYVLFATIKVVFAGK